MTACDDYPWPYGPRHEEMCDEIDRLRDELAATLADLVQPVGRLQMVHELHEAVFGSTWARPESPSEVWQMLLAEVRRQRSEESE